MQFHDVQPPENHGKGGAKKNPLRLRLPETHHSSAIHGAGGLIVFFLAAFLILFSLNAFNALRNGLSLKTQVLDTAAEGFEKMTSGAAALQEKNFAKAEKLFQEASDALAEIQSQAWFISPGAAQDAFSDPRLESVELFIAAARHLTQGALLFSKAAERLQFLPRAFFEENRADARGTGAAAPSTDAAPSAEPPSNQTRPSLTEKLSAEQHGIFAAAEELRLASESLEKIPESFIPREWREKFSFARGALTDLTKTIAPLKQDFPAILTLLGDKEPHTFLILLQNNAELRPSGGFIGNIAMVETNDGYITKTRVSDVYAFDHELREILEPPPEIKPVNERWFLRDSNFSPHFPLSAAKAAWFLEKEGGPGVDTVIAVDTTFIEDLLRLTGGVKIASLPRPIGADEFAVIISYLVEAKIFGRENPKIVLQEFLPAFEKAVFERTDPIALLPLFRNTISRKHLLAYSKDPIVQDFFEERGMAGLMADATQKDYLAISHTSIGGNKSDAFINEKIEHETHLARNGSMVNRLTITRKHWWSEETANNIRAILRSQGFPEISERLLSILGQAPNLTWLRIYVPAGSELVTGDVPTFFDAETGKTYFLVKMETPMGQEKTLTLSYRLPFRLKLSSADTYSLTVQKQPGMDSASLVKKIVPEAGILNYSFFGVWSAEMPLDRDRFFSGVWGK